jgi:hypothetical protein
MVSDGNTYKRLVQVCCVCYLNIQVPYIEEYLGAQVNGVHVLPHGHQSF